MFEIKGCEIIYNDEQLSKKKNRLRVQNYMKEKTTTTTSQKRTKRNPKSVPGETEIKTFQRT